LFVLFTLHKKEIANVDVIEANANALDVNIANAPLHLNTVTSRNGKNVIVCCCFFHMKRNNDNCHNYTRYDK